MIPRILVPKDARLATPSTDARPRRTSSDLDARTLVPSNLPHFEIDPRSSIPSYFKLEVLGSPVVVPRDMPLTPLDTSSKTPDYVPITILDSRVAVPKGAHALEFEPKQAVAIQDLPDLLEPDVFTTGEVMLMAKPVEEGTSAWNTVARAASVAVHFLLLLLIIIQPKVFPSKESSSSEIARQNVTDLYLPPGAKEAPKTPAPPPPKPKVPQIRIDPRLLGEYTGPPHQPLPPPKPSDPETVEKNNPAPAKPAPSMLAPKPQIAQAPPVDSPIRPPTLPPDTSHSGLILPRSSPGKALQDNMREALKDGGTGSAPFSLPPPSAGAPGDQEPLGGGLEVLTPTEGVDFTSYFQRMLATVYRNWIAALPESARMGERGKVILQFRVMQNGSVPESEPVMYMSSQKGALDQAAVSAIRLSSPFEPLPHAFTGPYIEIRFTFKYNMGRSE